MNNINTYSDIWRRDKLTAKFEALDASLFTAEVALTETNIIAMYTTPVEVVASPGAGKALQFVDAVLIYDYDTAAYTGGGTVNISFHGGAIQSNNISAANSFAAAGDKVYRVNSLNAAGGYSCLVNTALVITNATGVFVDPGTAAGVGRLKVTYRVITTEL